MNLQSLNQKWHGLPVWVWAAITVVVLYLAYRWWQNRSSSSSSNATDTTNSTDTAPDTGGPTDVSPTPTVINGDEVTTPLSPTPETTPITTTSEPSGGNGATTPPKHKSGKKKPHHHAPKKHVHTPGHGTKAHNTHGHTTHSGHSTHKKPSTKGTHSHKAIPKVTGPAIKPGQQETDVAKNAHNHPDVTAAKQAHAMNNTKKTPSHEKEPDKKPNEHRTVKKASKVPVHK